MLLSEWSNLSTVCKELRVRIIRVGLGSIVASSFLLARNVAREWFEVNEFRTMHTITQPVFCKIAHSVQYFHELLPCVL